jgi:hypothetical protein
MLSRLIRLIGVIVFLGPATLADEFFCIPIAFGTASMQISIIVTRDVLPFGANPAAHHRLTIVLSR